MSSFSSLLLFFFFPCKFPDIFLISRPRCNKRATQVSNNFSYQNFRIIRLFLYRETRLSRCNKIQVVIVSISIIFWFLIYIKTYDYYFLIFIKKLSYASVQQIQNYSDFSYQNPHQNRFWRTYCSKTSRSGNRIDSTFLIPDYYIILSIKTCLIIFLKKKKSSITLIQNPTIFISDDLSLDAVKNRFYFSQISDPWFIFQLRPNSTFSVKIRTIFISIKNILRYPNPSSFPFDKQIFSPKKIPPKIETSLSLSPSSRISSREVRCLARATAGLHWKMSIETVLTDNVNLPRAQASCAQVCLSLVRPEWCLCVWCQTLSLARSRWPGEERTTHARKSRSNSPKSPLIFAQICGNLKNRLASSTTSLLTFSKVDRFGNNF